MRGKWGAVHLSQVWVRKLRNRGMVQLEPRCLINTEACEGSTTWLMTVLGRSQSEQMSPDGIASLSPRVLGWIRVWRTSAQPDSVHSGVTIL